MDHFRDVVPSQSLGLVLKKLNSAQQKQATRKKWSKLKQKTWRLLNLNKVNKHQDLVMITYLLITLMAKEFWICWSAFGKVTAKNIVADLYLCCIDIWATAYITFNRKAWMLLMNSSSLSVFVSLSFLTFVYFCVDVEIKMFW